MKRRRRFEDWSVDQLARERPRIAFPEYQREKSLWSEEKKSMLIDSILEDIDIPKLYFNELKDETIEVVDGQQRLWSVWEFLNDEYGYRANGHNYSFSKLTLAQQKAIREYKFQIIVFEDADEDYLRQLFVRLQLGLLLNTGEKLHAATGRIKKFVFDVLANHPFIQAIGVPKRRYAKQTLCAQICINSFAKDKIGSFARTRYDDLIQFFIEYADPRGKDLDRFRKQTKRIPEVLDILWESFGARSNELRNRSYILSIYLFVEEHGLTKNERNEFGEFCFILWKRLREEAKLGMERKNRELYSFQSLLSSAPGEEYQIKRRHEKLNEYFEYFKTKHKIKGD